MKDKERKLRAIRAADGESPPADVDPELRDFLAEEKDAADFADALAAPLRLKGSLEEDVLRRMGMKPPYRFVLLIAGLAATALVAVLLLWNRDAPERVASRETARFEPVEGEGAQGSAPGVYHLAQGKARVTVDEPTLVQTGAGVVELAPGSYEIEVVSGKLTVKTTAGEAVIRAGERRLVVASGETRAVEASPEPAAVEAVAEGAETGPGARVVGRVVDANSQPVAGAGIWVSGRGVAARTDEDGRFDTTVGGAQAYVGVQATGFAPSDLRRIAPASAPVFEMDFALLHKGGGLEIRVLDEENNPVAGAHVVLGTPYYRNLPMRAKSPEGYPLSAPRPRDLTTDAQGRVAADGLAPQWNRVLVEAAGFAPHETWVRVAPEGMEKKVVKLVRGGVITGTVTDAGGGTLEGTLVVVRHPLSGRPYPGVEARTDAAGRFELASVPPTKVEIVATAPDGRRTAAWLEPGETRTWSGTLEAGKVLEGKVVLADGTPVVNALILCSRAWRGVGAKPVNVRTGEGGTFRIEALPEALHMLRIWHPTDDYSVVRVPAKEVQVLPSASPVTIELPPDAGEEPGALVGVIARPDGGEVDKTLLHAWPAGRPGWRTSAVAGADGAFRLGPLVPGTYTLEVHRDGQPTLLVKEVAVTAGQESDLGTVSFPSGGRIRGRIRSRDGTVWPHGTITVQSLDQSIFYTVKKQEDGYGLSEQLAPGRYLVLGGGAGVIEEVEVRPGETRDVELTVRPGRRVDLTFRLADGSAPREVSYRVRDGKGRSVYYANLDHGENEVSFWLASGQYRVTVEDDRKHTSGVDFRVEPGPGPHAIDVTLR